MSVSNPQESPTPTSLREQIVKDVLVHDLDCQYSLYDRPCTCVQSKVADNLIKIFTTYIETADNIKLIANATLPAKWTDPLTGAKVYNQAYIEAAKRETQLQSQLHEVSLAVGRLDAGIYEVVTYLRERKEFLWKELAALQAQKAVLEEK